MFSKENVLNIIRNQMMQNYNNETVHNILIEITEQIAKLDKPDKIKTPLPINTKVYLPMGDYVQEFTIQKYNFNGINTSMNLIGHETRPGHKNFGQDYIANISTTWIGYNIFTNKSDALSKLKSINEFKGS